MKPFWAEYKAHPEAYDEMFDREGRPRAGYSRVLAEFLATHADKFDEIRARADQMFLNGGSRSTSMATALAPSASSPSTRFRG